VLYDNEKMAKVFKQLLEGSAEKLFFTTKHDVAHKAFVQKKCDLLVSIGNHNSAAYKEKLSPFILERRETPVVLCGTAPLSLKVKKIYQKQGFDNFHTLTKNSRHNNLFFENVLKEYRSSGSIAFLSSMMVTHLENIKPLPQTIRQIQKLQFDHDASLQELIKIIVQDAALSIDIIKRANAPINGLRQAVTTVQNAVTLLGKDRTIATALSCNVANTMPINLAPYGMTMDEFNAVANLRMNLMMHWYQKISKNDAGILMTAALMGNIGQLVIALEMARQQKEEEFKSLSEEAGATFAELELFFTTCEDLTAEILEEWGLHETIVDALAFCHNLESAPQDILPFAVALHAIFKIVPQTQATFDAEAIDKVCALLEYHKIDPQPLLNAVVVCEEKYLAG
jgi:HD-like signal output (HDOD) protein